MNEFSASSPQHSEILSDENDVSSNRDTLLLKEPSTSKSSAFKTAYKPVQKEPKPIVQGRKTFAFWTLVVLIFLLTIGNLVLTATIFGVLKLAQGMQSIEFLPQDQSIQLSGDVDLGRIYKQNGVVEGYKGENLDVAAENSALLINLNSKQNRVFNKLKIDKNHTRLADFKSFQVNNRKKESIFDAINPTFKNLQGVNLFASSNIETNKIRSKLDENLRVEGATVVLKGNEGTKAEGKISTRGFG